MRSLLPWLLMAAASVSIAAPLEQRDLNGDGFTDAYFDAGHNQTWLTAVTGNGTLADAWTFQEQANAYAPAGWRLPHLLDSTSTDSCTTGTFGEIQSCHREVFAGSSELSRLAAESGMHFAAAWADGLLVAQAEGQSYYLTPIVASAGVDTFLSDPYPYTAAFVFVADGDWGAGTASRLAAISPAPEAGTYALLLAGLAALGLRRQVGIRIIPRPPKM
jgi:hypothetical protein